MCGIAGFIRKEKADSLLLKKMGEALKYRGPDDAGEFLEPYNNDYLVGLSHRRLSIIDLSPLGHQPMFSQDQRIVLIFNGEIYNFQSIRSTLETKGYSFKSHSDTEVLISAYQEWGIDFVHLLNGMFSIALYDRKTKDFYLIRDRMGVKPLYYFQDAGGLIFGSELKALMVHPVFQKKLNKHALSLFLCHGYIVAPHTIFEHTYKLMPGTYLHFKDGIINHHTYWSLEEKFKQRQIVDIPEEEWVDNIESFLLDSIKKRLISDVPVGCFLSGGVDSSLVAALMKKVSNSSVKTFTIGFHGSAYNEAPYAKKVSEHLGTEHTETYISVNEAKNLISQIPIYYDEPFADSSQIPTMLLSRVTRQKVTVALSGDGGDELFCGYRRYEDILKLKKLSLLSKAANQVPFFKETVKKVKGYSRYGKFFELRNEHDIINSDYLNYLKNYSFIKDFVPIFDSAYSNILKASVNFQEQHMLQDMTTYLPDDILVKVDRASMASSLEARAPFIDDHEFVELSFQIPHALKYKNNQAKYLLKKLLYRYVPSSLIDRPKMGFGIPVYEWLKNDLRHLVDEYLSLDYVRKQNIFCEEEICILKELFLKSSQKDGIRDRTIWHLIVFQLWYEQFMN
ncbi:MAG: asparagine synthase (glutamine-hydrolyzing) [Alphaproteobacteria bacterium]